MSHGANDRHLVSDLRGVSEILAEFDAFNRRVDRAVRTTVFRGCVGFGIPGFVLGHSSGKEDLDHRFRDTFTGLVILLGGLCLHTEELGEGEAETSKEANVEESTSGKVVGEWVSGAGLVHENG